MKFTDDDSRWAAGLRAFLRNIAGAITALGIIGGGIGWMMLPRIEAWVGSIVDEAFATATFDARENTRQLQSVSASMATTTRTLVDLVGRVEELEARRARKAGPLIRFSRFGHKITNGRPGDTVDIAWQFFKLSACGAPQVGVFFRNGGGYVHRFQDVSLLSRDGRGVEAEIDLETPQIIQYTARIPDNEGVRPGLGYGWVTIAYPDCPLIKPVTSPEVGFRILPKE